MLRRPRLVRRRAVKVFRSRRRVEPGAREKRDNDLSGRLVTVSASAGAAAEAYRSLRATLLYAFADNPPQVIVLTSPGHGDGKSTISANLGAALGQTDKKVLLADCDFRTPAMHKIFGLRNTFGVVNVLAGEHELPEVWHEPLPGLRIVTAGLQPPNPAELLGSRQFAEFLDQLRQEFDYILLDTPPVGLFSDVLAIAPRADGVLLVIDAQNTRKGSVWHSVRSLRAVRANMLGTIMNKAKVAGGDNHYYEHYR